jgi:hypothetical protein
MAQVEAPRHRPRIFNTPFESGLRSVIILTACYPAVLALNRLVVFDHLIVHTDDFGVHRGYIRRTGHELPRSLSAAI